MLRLAKLTEYFEPKKNIPFERHRFRQAAQKRTENMDSYVTRLRSLAKSCEYGNVYEMIRDQVFDKCASNTLRRRLLRETDLTLDGLLQIARSIEASVVHATKMEEASDKSRSKRFVVGLKDQMRKTGEVRGRVDQRMRGILLSIRGQVSMYWTALPLTHSRIPELFSDISVSKCTRTARKHPSQSKEFLTQMSQHLNFKRRPTLLLLKIYMRVACRQKNHNRPWFLRVGPEYPIMVN